MKYSIKKTLLSTTNLYRPLHDAISSQGITIQSISLDNYKGVDLTQTLGCVVDFYMCMRYPIGYLRLKRYMNRAGIPILAWNRDAPHYLNKAAWRLKLMEKIHLIDIYATHTLVDDRRFAEAQIYLPNAADTDSYNITTPSEVFSRMSHPENYLYDVTFFGGMNGSRYKEDQARQDFFQALAGQLELQGLKYLFVEAQGLSVPEQIALVQSSRINLNYGARCEYGAHTASGLPERCYGIPACGGFLLSDRRAHSLTDFTPGFDWAEFVDIEDCIAKIQYWLSNFQAARRVAENAYKTVRTRHTYKNRAETLIAELMTWSEQKPSARRFCT
jgi:spore maturation protein CgeB